MAELAVARREVELLRERLVEVQSERDRLGELLRVALENNRRDVPPGDRLRLAVERMRAALRSAMEALRGPPGAATGGDRRE
jgi:hypothetical protein